VDEPTDCPRCVSAGSIEHGICQVCLVSSPRVIVELPDPGAASAPGEQVVQLPAAVAGTPVVVLPARAV